MACKRQVLRTSAFLFFFLVRAFSISARMRADIDTVRPYYSGLAKITALPNLEQCTHKTGRLWFSVTNYGVLGNQRNVFLRDCLTGGVTSSAEFPGGSGVEYLFQGALWVGGIVGKDTLTSISNDGWAGIREIFPEAGANGAILRRSANLSSPYYSPEAVSDQDFIATYYDTLKDPRLVTSIDPDDGKPHKPMGLKVVQKSYSWSAGWGQDWVLLDYTITNIGNERIRRAYAGLFIDPDIGNINSGKATHTDDYCGFRAQVVLDTCKENIENLNIAYAYDNDGDPEEDGGYGLKSPTGALGVRVLRAGQALRPDGTLNADLSFNWWVPDSSAMLDWGPQKRPGRASFFGGRGQPLGDAMRYYYLANQEIDYDQIYGALDYGVVDPFSAGIWRPPLPSPISSIDIANGADSRFLLSVGPFDLDAGESWPVTFAVFAGPAIHSNPANFATNFPTSSDFLNPANISSYKAGLELGGLIENARMVRKIFDNDTENSGDFCGIFCHFNNINGQFTYVCDSLFKARFHGDGIPDFKGPVPPPYPKVEFSTAEGEVTIRWFGRETENAFDPISGLQDFEGYRVLMSPNGVDYTIIGSFDKVDWKPYFLNTRQIDTFLTLGTWQPTSTPPLSWDEIQRMYAVRQNLPPLTPEFVGWDTCQNKIDPVTGAFTIGHPINPDRFGAPTQVRFSARWPSLDATYCRPDTIDQATGIPLTAIRIRFCNFCSPLGRFVDSIFYFARQDYNLGLDKVRMYPAVTNPANDSAYWYQFKMTGLFPSQPLWFSVVPFDNGWATPFQKIAPQEGTPYAATYLVYPIASDSVRRADSLKISVYPNPYRIDQDYSFFEKRQPATGHPQSSKRINFVNLPPKCAIRIYTLDGDLVQQINHDKDPNTSDAGYEFWDLLSRNAQKVVAGLYLYTVESNEGRYIGKIIIIQ